MESADLLSWASAQPIARDAALAIVADHSEDWMSLAMIEMREFSYQHSYKSNHPNGFTNTNIRQWLVPLIGNPNHPNAWGAFVMKCVKAGLIEDTGKISRMGAHARKQTVYQWRQ